MIDINNGDIRLTKKTLVIRKGLTIDEFAKSDLFEDVYKKDEYEYTRFFVGLQFIGENQFAVSLLFNPLGRLYSIHLKISIDGKMPSWDNWSEEGELRIKDMHDMWLKKNVGDPPYNYSWGTIYSTYDPRSASSSMGVRFKN